MRGARGGLKDQIKAFREFLIRRKKKKKALQEELKLKKKREKEIKKNRTVYNDSSRLFSIVDDIIFDKKIDNKKVIKELDILEKKKCNIPILDKIEEVKKRVEVEILFEEILSKDVSEIKSTDKNKQKKFIDMSVSFIDKSNNVNEINHYYSKILSVSNKHTTDKKILEESKKNNAVLEELILIESKTVESLEKKGIVQIIESGKKKVDKKLLDVDDSQIEETHDKQIDKTQNKGSVKYEKSYGFNDNVEVLDVVFENDNNSFDVIGDKDFSEESYFIEDDLIEESLEFIESEDLNKSEEVVDIKAKALQEEIVEIENESFDFSDFEVLKKNNMSHILICETMVKDLQKMNVYNIFKEKSFFEKLVDFGSNLFSLGKGLIGKHFFSNNLVKRMNNDIIINNSLKAMHRVFSDDKKEVPYIVFADFEREINSKKDCAIKIGEICEDSLMEINKLRSDFLMRYGAYSDREEVKAFIKKIDDMELRVSARQKEAKTIEKKVLEQYKKNKQMVKVMK